MSDLERFGDAQLDVLREVGNIGSGHAATALAKLLGKPIEMKVPRVNLVPFDEIGDLVGGSETVVCAVLLRVVGDAPGNLFFIVTLESARKLLLDIVGLSPSDGASLSELETSALSEIGNILAGSYLSSLADLTKLRFIPSVPSLATDMAGAILAYGVLMFGDMGDRAMLIETSLFEGLDQVESYLFLIPDPDSIPTLFRSLGVSPE